MPVREEDLLAAAEGPVIAVDSGNVIEFANEEALALVGWDATLVGQALTTIIPPRLRHRHLQGFHRYVATGVSNLQGRTVRVPALRRDGSEVEVDLTIRVFQRPDGSRLAVAALVPAATGKPPPHLVVLEQAFVKRLYELV